MKILLMILVLAASAVAQSVTDGKAVIYVYSLSAATTFGTVKKPVFLDGKELADIRPERYFIVLVEPGKHSLHLKNKKLGGIEKDFAAGETYYMKVEWRSGAVVSPSGFVNVAKDNAAFDLKQLKPVDKKNVKDSSTVVLSLPCHVFGRSSNPAIEIFQRNVKFFANNFRKGLSIELGKIEFRFGQKQRRLSQCSNLIYRTSVVADSYD